MWRETLFGKDVVNQETMNTAIAILKRMDKDRAECNQGSSQDGIAGTVCQFIIHPAGIARSKLTGCLLGYALSLLI
jgi:hypothetical protein